MFYLKVLSFSLKDWTFDTAPITLIKELMIKSFKAAPKCHHRQCNLLYEECTA